MANWITHTIIADKVLEKLSFPDKKGFCIGNIAPDCNVENEDWTAFEPPREMTHFMSGKSKLTADYEKFYDLYVRKKKFSSDEHYSFLLGYYSHLMTDVMWVEYMHNEDRVRVCFDRIKAHSEMRKELSGLPEEYEVVKQVFGRKCFLNDAAEIEHRYIAKNAHNSYNEIVRKTTNFPDYLDFLPAGAIARKIKIMAYEPPEAVEEKKLIFLTEEEYRQFVDDTSRRILTLIKGKCS